MNYIRGEKLSCGEISAYHLWQLWGNWKFLHMWRNFGKFWEILGNFGKFWEILPQFLRFNVEKNWAQKYICGEKMTNMRSEPSVRACEDDINGICRCNAMNCKSLKENNILRHNWVSFWGKGPSFGRPSACLSFTCWSYLYFESSCFEQDLLQLSFLKNKQQFTENFKYHHSSYIAFYHITMFDKCLFW